MAFYLHDVFRFHDSDIFMITTVLTVFRFHEYRLLIAFRFNQTHEWLPVTCMSNLITTFCFHEYTLHFVFMSRLFTAFYFDHTHISYHNSTVCKWLQW